MYKAEKVKREKSDDKGKTNTFVTHTRLVRIWLVEMLVSKSLCLVSVMLQRLPAVLSRIGIILASPLVRPPIALGRGHDFARYPNTLRTFPLGLVSEKSPEEISIPSKDAGYRAAWMQPFFLHIFSFSLFLVLSLGLPPYGKEAVCTCKVLTAS